MQKAEPEWGVGTVQGKAKNHAIYRRGIKAADVPGGGYPLGDGWAPHSEKLAQEIAHKLNCHNRLLGMLEEALARHNEGQLCTGLLSAEWAEKAEAAIKVAKGDE